MRASVDWLRRSRGLARAGLPLLLVVVSWGSLRPAPEMMGVAGADKLLHLLAYGLIAGVARWAGLRGVWAVALAALWGAGLELGQGWMPTGRDASLADAAANLVGALLGAGVASGTLARWKASREF